MFENSAANSHKYSRRIGIVERRTALAELDGLDWHGRNVMQYEYGVMILLGADVPNPFQRFWPCSVIHRVDRQLCRTISSGSKWLPICFPQTAFCPPPCSFPKRHRKCEMCFGPAVLHFHASWRSKPCGWGVEPRSGGSKDKNAWQNQRSYSLFDLNMAWSFVHVQIFFLDCFRTHLSTHTGAICPLHHSFLLPDCALCPWRRLVDPQARQQTNIKRGGSLNVL